MEEYERLASEVNYDLKFHFKMSSYMMTMILCVMKREVNL